MADNNKKKTNITKGFARAKHQAKKEAAIARQEERNKKTKEQQIAELDMMFGVGLGAAKERARLNKTE